MQRLNQLEATQNKIIADSVASSTDPVENASGVRHLI